MVVMELWVCGFHVVVVVVVMVVGGRSEVTGGSSHDRYD